MKSEEALMQDNVLGQFTRCDLFDGDQGPLLVVGTHSDSGKRTSRSLWGNSVSFDGLRAQIRMASA